MLLQFVHCRYMHVLPQQCEILYELYNVRMPLLVYQLYFHSSKCESKNSDWFHMLSAIFVYLNNMSSICRICLFSLLFSSIYYLLLWVSFSLVYMPVVVLPLKVYLHIPHKACHHNVTYWPHSIFE